MKQKHPNAGKKPRPSARARPFHRRRRGPQIRSWLAAGLFVWVCTGNLDHGVLIARAKELLTSAQPAFTATAAQPPADNRAFARPMSCRGKTRCSQFTDCNEALFYLNHCHARAIDGDHDGVPCEDQLCGH